MYQFPKNLYTDVRIEDVTNTNIVLSNHELQKNKTQKEVGAMIRIYDGIRWYYKATSDVKNVQKAIDELAQMATPNEKVNECPEIAKLEVNVDKVILYKEQSFAAVPNEEKVALITRYDELTKVDERIQSADSIYLDCYTHKHFMSSLGADVEFDDQYARVIFLLNIVDQEIPNHFHEHFNAKNFEEIAHYDEWVREHIAANLEFAQKAVPVEPGDYVCVMSPSVTGVFAHESFGHKSESDFMLNDETMRKEWEIGKKVGSDILSITDDGTMKVHGYTPYDDEGCKARKTYLVKNGVLEGRLHSALTAACIGEELTGNARALNFEYEPVVRMTNTMVEPGTLTKEELFADIELGIYIHDWKHGSGMSSFTIAPSKSYMIRNGKIAEPVRVSVVTGNVMETLYLIDAVSKDLQTDAGSCGKMEQMGLPVAMGGPYTRVRKLNVQ